MIMFIRTRQSVLTAVLLVVVFLGLVALFAGAKEEAIETKVYDIKPMELEQLRAEQLARLEGPARLEVTKIDDQVTDSRIVIPIETAMELVVKETSRP